MRQGGENTNAEAAEGDDKTMRRGCGNKGSKHYA